MKANELMIGDWVNLKTDIGNKPCVIKEIRYKRLTFSTSARDLWGNEDSEEWFEPIPLTPEILEKNGFYTYCESEGIFFIEVSTDYSIIKKWFTYIHELQHALRLCGLDELAENFIV